MKNRQLRNLVVKFIVLLSFTPIKGQTYENMNLIIMIDDAIVLNHINPKIIIQDPNGLEIDTMEAKYVPGNLSLVHDISKFESGSLYITMDNDGHFLNYSIPIGSNWFEQAYIVLRIYNLDNKKYRRKFRTTRNKGNYTYELDYPGGSMLRINK